MCNASRITNQYFHLRCAAKQHAEHLEEHTLFDGFIMLRQHRAARLLQSTPPFSRAKMTVHQSTNGAAQPVTLVSFDVDGTLIHSIGKEANKLHKESFTAGFKEVFDLDTNIDVVEHHGSTDPLIILKVLEHHGIPRHQAMPKLPEVQAAMTHYFVSQASRAGLGLELLPGVQALLEALKARGDVITCLVTGNLEPVGWGKMQALGIEHLFTQPRFGGFGSDLCSGNYEESWRDRSEFVKLAVQRASNLSTGGLKACFHVGDTPMDVQAALAAGSTAVAVATGIFSRQQLEACAAGAPAGSVTVLDGLEDIPEVLRTFQLV